MTKATDEKVIVYEDVQLHPVCEGWYMCSDGNVYKGEHTARWVDCTHHNCNQCGILIPKLHARCATCQARVNDDRYEAMPQEDYDGKSPLYSDAFDEYFHYGTESIADFLSDFDDGDAPTLKQLRLQLCRPVYCEELDGGYFLDDAPEDFDLPEKIHEAIVYLNKVIKEENYILYWEPKFTRPILTEEFIQACA